MSEAEYAVVVVADAKAIAGAGQLDEAEEFIVGFEFDAANAFAGA